MTEEKTEEQKRIEELEKKIERMEGGVKQVMYYLTLYMKECDAKKIEYDDWAYNVRLGLSNLIGTEHVRYDLNFGVIFMVWIVIEVWRDGRVIPRCVSMTESRAEQAKDSLMDLYESDEPKNRPIISIEHQRMEHLFGYSMYCGKMRFYQGRRSVWD